MLLLRVDKRELKTFLRFLNGDYYKSPLSNMNFIAASKRALPKTTNEAN